jgi:hypothetical protein
MTTPIVFPLINGVRHDFSSIELRIAGQILVGFKSINYKRTRTRTMVEGNSPDPIGKTLGTNAYSCDAEIWLAEWNYLQSLLQAQAAANGASNGNGYGDVFFKIVVSYTALGFDTITDSILGCTLDELDASQSKSADPIARKLGAMNPIKILFGNQDDLTNPLAPPPTT